MKNVLHRKLLDINKYYFFKKISWASIQYLLTDGVREIPCKNKK